MNCIVEPSAKELDKVDKKAQRKHWAATYTCLENEPEGYPKPEQIWPDAKVLIYNVEIASTGWQHYQCQVTFPAAKRFAEVRSEMLDAGCKKPVWCWPFTEKDKDAKLELLKYRKYCCKKKDPKGGLILRTFLKGWEGDKVTTEARGKRNDLEEFRAYLQEHKTVDVMAAPPNILTTAARCGSSWMRLHMRIEELCKPVPGTLVWRLALRSVSDQGSSSVCGKASLSVAQRALARRTRRMRC